MMEKYLLKFTFIVIACLFVSMTAISSDLGENIVDDHNANGTDTLDDSSAIMAAINAATATGGSKLVIIPKGTFYLDSTINLNSSQYSNLTLRGIGRESILKHRGGDCAIKLGDGTSGGSASYMVLKDFTIDGINASASAGIYVNRSHRNQFSNLYIKGYTSTNSGAESEGGACMKFKYSWIHTVRECFFLNSYNGIYLSTGSSTANNLNVVDCVIEMISNVGIYLQGASAVNISGCCIEGGGMKYGVYAKTGTAYAIQNSYFEGIADACVYLENSAYLCAVTISGNYMRIQNADYAIDIYGVKGAKISGNYFGGIPNEAVVKTRTRGYVRNVWLTGNSHSPGDGETLWDGYDYIKKYDSTKLFSGGVWENMQDKKIIYGSWYTLAQDS
jgi:pectate lyase-like protein